MRIAPLLLMVTISCSDKAPESTNSPSKTVASKPTEPAIAPPAIKPSVPPAAAPTPPQPSADEIADDTAKRGEFISEDVLGAAADFLTAMRNTKVEAIREFVNYPFRIYDQTGIADCPESTKIENAAELPAAVKCIKQADMMRGLIPAGLSMASSRLQFVGANKLPKFTQEPAASAMKKLAKTHKIVRFTIGSDDTTTAFLAVRSMPDQRARVAAMLLIDTTGD